MKFADASPDAIPLYLIDQDNAENWLAAQSETVQNWAALQGWSGSLGGILQIPDGDGGLAGVAIGHGTPTARQRSRFGAIGKIGQLPKGSYALAGGDDCVSDPASLRQFALAWLLAQYRFDRYAPQSAPGARLVAPSGVDGAALENIAAGDALTRDLINIPSGDMGPAELAQAAQSLAAEFGASFSEILDGELLAQNLPMIHAVGRASDRRPRLLDIRWGDAGPTLTLVGKGVCFDTGGLNIKPGASMGLMKKDMGGSAHVLGLARMIMGAGLCVRLRVLIPAVENSISGNAFRPGDILTSRKGLTVEINNTDAEGRLVLADALALADEETPDLILCMATLTGAARVAVGPDLAPYFTDDPGLVAALETAAPGVEDPIWRLPLHPGYEAVIEPGIADLDNAPKGGFAGASTAALFLRRFVSETPRFAHFDVYGWQPSSAPARPKGGAMQGARAIFAALPDMLGL